MAEKKTILVTGANGQLGNEIRVISGDYPVYSFLFVTKEDLAIDDIEAVNRYFATHVIDYCVNCAAYTAVDKAETEQEKAYLINATAVGNLAEICKKNRTQFIHISTDYVFDGTATAPYKESDPVNPVNLYGASKLKGEELAMQNNPNSIIIRTSWVYASFGNNFVKTMLRLGKERPELRVVYDQIGTPTYARDLAKAVLDILQKVAKGEVKRSLLHGIYNYSNEGVTSWYDFAKAIFEINDIDCKVMPIETKDYPTPAARPPYSVLHKTKIKEAFGLEIPYWKHSLQSCLAIF